MWNVRARLFLRVKTGAFELRSRSPHFFCALNLLVEGLQYGSGGWLREQMLQ